MDLLFSGEVISWRGPAPHHFVRLPDDDADRVAEIAAGVTYGWGMVPVVGRIGASRFATSLWPKDGGYLLPIRADVRRSEGFGLGDVVTVGLSVEV